MATYIPTEQAIKSLPQVVCIQCRTLFLTTYQVLVTCLRKRLPRGRLEEVLARARILTRYVEMKHIWRNIDL